MCFLLPGILASPHLIFFILPLFPFVKHSFELQQFFLNFLGKPDYQHLTHSFAVLGPCLQSQLSLLAKGAWLCQAELPVGRMASTGRTVCWGSVTSLKLTDQVTPPAWKGVSWGDGEKSGMLVPSYGNTYQGKTRFRTSNRSYEEFTDTILTQTSKTTYPVSLVSLFSNFCSYCSFILSRDIS